MYCSDKRATWAIGVCGGGNGKTSTKSFCTRFLGEKRGQVRFEPYVSVRGKGMGRVIKDDLQSTKSRTDRGFISKRSTPFCTQVCRDQKVYNKRVVLLGTGSDPCCRRAGGRTLTTLHTCPKKLRINKKVASTGTSRFLRTNTSTIVIASFIFQSKQVSCSYLGQLRRTIKGRRLMLSLSYECQTSTRRPNCCVMASQ